MVDKKKLKMHLEAALACLGGDDEDMPEASDEGDDDEGDDGDLAMKSMKMSLGKYK